MQREEDIFLAILRSILFGDKQDTPAIEQAQVDWRALLDLAFRQKCLHAFSMWCKTHGIATPYDKKLQRNMFVLMQRHARLNHLAKDVMALLAQEDIPSVLIKGYSLACYYPDPDTRDFGDVDIYVGEEHYIQAAEILKAAYPDAHWHSDIRGGIHFILVLDESLDRVVELHRVTMEFADNQANMLYQDFTRRYLEDSTDSVEIYGQWVQVPSVAYNALYVFMHAWHHFESTGVGFRQLGDWALCLQRAHKELSQAQWQALIDDYRRILSALHLMRAWQTFGYVLVNHLNLPADALPFYDPACKKRAMRLMRQLLRDGHGLRPTKFRLHEMTLMRRMAWERPKSNRCLQKAYTFCRLLFNAWQMSKFFPEYAWFDWMAVMNRATERRGKNQPNC